MNSQEFLMNEFEHSLIFLSDMSGSHIKMLTFNGTNFPFPDTDGDTDAEYRLYRPLYKFMGTLENLTTFRTVRMCNDYMLQILAKCCPLLEEINVELSYSVSDDGVAYLCGFSNVSDAENSLKIANLINRKKNCGNLKRVFLDFTLASNLSVATLLQWCPLLEEVNITPDINIGEVFTMIYGSDTLSYNLVTRKYNLTTFRSSLEIDDVVLSLIVDTCPNLQDVSLRCYGVQRKDKNLLAPLLKVPIHSLDLMNCNTEPLLWYLQQRGSLLSKLVIEHLITAPPGVFLNRSHIQLIISFCSKLSHFSLKMCGNVSISPNVPYSSFGEDLKYFTTLKDLCIEGVNLQPDDVRILMGRCTDIEDISLMCQSLEILEDSLLYELLALGSLKKLKSFYAFRPFLTYVGLRRLLTECPLLEKVGPLSSWAIPRKERDILLEEIKSNNWNLNIDWPEMLNTFFF